MQAKALDTQDKRTSEIAAAVQAGKADILSLWAAVERFAWQQALRWTRAMEGRAGVEESDLLQVAFISLMDTLPTWDADKGEFLTLYGIKLRAAFTEACGQRTQRARYDPINSVCRSMDEPIISSFNSCKSNCSVVCTCSLICFHLLSEKLTFALDGHGSAYERHLSDRRLHDRVESIVIVHSVTSMLCISSLTDTPDRSVTKEKCVPC